MAGTHSESEEIAMKMNRILVVAMAGLGVAGWSMSASADAAAGKAKFEAACAECHEAGDFEGEDAKALADSLTKMAAGTMKHKQAIKLSPAEITDVAAYMATGGK
jgi:mono/diheme cytochrome c family protein